MYRYFKLPNGASVRAEYIDIPQDPNEERGGTDCSSEAVAHGKQHAPSDQVGGTHYSDMAIEPWDYILANDLGYMEGSIISYISRWRNKGGVEDLRKAQHYIEKLIQAEELGV